MITAPETKLCHGYRYKNRLVIALMAGVDSVVRLFPRKKRVLPENVTRILLMKPDHLGDLLLTTAIFPLLAARYPGVAIDLLCGSWGKAVVDGNRFLRKIIVLDHPGYNRSPLPLFRKLLDFWQSLMHTMKILRKEPYDLCLNLRDAGGELILLARIGSCRHIIGHATGGLGGLLDRVVPWQEGKHEAEHYLELLEPLGIQADLTELRYCLSVQPADELFVAELLERRQLKQYAVIHPGSGDRRKLRTNLFWKDVIAGIPDNCSIVVTGSAAERSLFEEMAAVADRKIVSLMGELTIPRLLVLFRSAERVYSLDSLAAHLGAAAGVRTIVFWSATNNPAQWRPLGDRVELVG